MPCVEWLRKIETALASRFTHHAWYAALFLAWHGFCFVVAQQFHSYLLDFDSYNLTFVSFCTLKFTSSALQGSTQFGQETARTTIAHSGVLWTLAILIAVHLFELLSLERWYTAISLLLPEIVHASIWAGCKLAKVTLHPLIDALLTILVNVADLGLSMTLSLWLLSDGNRSCSLLAALIIAGVGIVSQAAVRLSLLLGRHGESIQWYAMSRAHWIPLGAAEKWQGTIVGLDKAYSKGQGREKGGPAKRNRRGRKGSHGKEGIERSDSDKGMAYPWIEGSTYDIGSVVHHNKHIYRLEPDEDESDVMYPDDPSLEPEAREQGEKPLENTGHPKLKSKRTPLPKSTTPLLSPDEVISFKGSGKLTFQEMPSHSWLGVRGLVKRIFERPRGLLLSMEFITIGCFATLGLLFLGGFNWVVCVITALPTFLSALICHANSHQYSVKILQRAPLEFFRVGYNKMREENQNSVGASVKSQLLDNLARMYSVAHSSNPVTPIANGSVQ